MSKSKKIMWVCLTVVGIGAATMVAGNAWADRGAGPGKKAAGGGHPFLQMLHQHLAGMQDLKDRLNLTPEQKQSVHQILQAHREEFRPLLQNVVEKHQDVRTAVLAENHSDEAIRAAATSLGSAIGDAAVYAANVVEELKGVLTADQLQILRDARANHLEHLQQFFDSMTQE